MKKALLFLCCMFVPSIRSADGNDTTVVIGGIEKSVNGDVIRISNLIKTMIEDFGDNGGRIEIQSVPGTLFFDKLYPLMEIVHERRGNEDLAKKEIEKKIKSLNLNETAKLFKVVNYFDVKKPVRPLVADRLSELICLRKTLQNFAQEENFVESLDMPEELLNSISKRIVRTTEVKKLLFDAFSKSPQRILAHSGPITAMVFSPDDKTIAINSPRRPTELLDIETGRVLHTFNHVGGRSFNLVAIFSHNGAKLATFCSAYFSKFYPIDQSNRVVKVWDAGNGKLLRELSNSDHVWSVAFLPNDGANQLEILITDSDDYVVRLWNVGTGEVLSAFNYDGSALSTSLSSNGALFATACVAGDSKLCELWEVKKGKIIRSFNHKGGVKSILLSHDGKKFAILSYDNELKVLNTETGASRSFNLEAGDRRRELSPILIEFSHDDTAIASYPADFHSVDLWGVSGEPFLHQFKKEGPVHSVAFSSKGDMFAVAGSDVKIWAVPPKKLPLEVTLMLSFISKNKDHLGNIASLQERVFSKVGDFPEKKIIGDFIQKEIIKQPL